MLLANALVGHLVGDYLFQGHWMALGKKRSTPICLLHCLLYTTAIWLFCLLAVPAWALLLIFLLHFLQDRTGVVAWLMDNVLGQRGFREGLAPWSSIVVDNVLHIVVLWALCALGA